jgi:hypothetical protein
MTYINQSENQFGARNRRLKRRKITYKDFLLSEKWQEIKLYLSQFEEFKTCSLCGSDHNLNFHHHTYHKMFRRLKLQKLTVVTLCNFCHNSLHLIARKNNWGLRQTFKNMKKEKTLR